MYHTRYEKPLKNHTLFVAKKGGNVSPSKAVARKLGEQVLLDRPYHNKTKKKKKKNRSHQQDWLT